MKFFFQIQNRTELEKKRNKNCIIPTNITYTDFYVNCPTIICVITFNIKDLIYT